MDDKQDANSVGTEPTAQERIHWHEAFYEALQHELGKYKDFLSFENERLLSKEALKMDVLIIKKDKNVSIEKNIGRIFKAHNIFEYKSETDYLSVHDYIKVLGYALLYASFEKVSVSDVSVSFALSRHPRDVLKYLESERGLKVEEVEDGIYYVTGDIVKVQILEQKKLSSKTNLFLKVLRSDAELSEAIDIINLWKQEDLSRKSKFLETVILANKDKFKEAMEVSTTLKGFFKEVVEENGWDNEKADEKTIEIVKRLLKRNRPIDEIVEDTGLAYQEVERLRNSVR